MLKFIEKVSETERQQFEGKVIAIAKDLGTDPNYLMAVMNTESSVNPKAVNPITKATGLIQFMPKTAASLGTTTDELKKMTGVQQLDFVRKYFQPYKGKLNTLADAYLTVFYPAAVGKLGTFTFPDKVLEQNPTFAKFLVGGKLTKDSIENYLTAKYPTLVTAIKENPKSSLAVILVLFSAIYLIIK